MIERIEVVLRNFTKDPGTQGRLLREMLEEDPKQFSSCALRSLQDGGDTRGHRYLITLLVQNGFLVQDLYNPQVFTRDVAIALARKIAQVQKHFDSGLARLLPGRDDGSPSVEGKVAERVLDLLDATSNGARLVPLINHLTQYSDMRLRSKAVLLVGQRLQDSRATEESLRELNPRVRANAVEALWGVDSSAARALLWRAVRDPSNRVMGNAIYGLYCLRAHEAIPHLLGMGVDNRPLHRASAAWVMGRTRDPRFLRPLERMGTDLYAVSRRNAAAALARIREAEEAAARLPGLELSVLGMEKMPNSGRHLCVRIQEAGGGFVWGLAPTNVMLWEDGELVVDYQLAEERASACIGVGFALCADSGISSAWLEAAGQAAAGCLPYRRAADPWAISKLTCGDRSGRFVWNQAVMDIERGDQVEPPRYQVDGEALRQAIGAAAIQTGSGPTALQAAQILLPGAGAVRGRRHLIMLAGKELAAAPDLHAAMHAALASKVAIHAVVAGEPQASLAALCRQTGGGTVVASAPEDLGNAYRQIYLGLLDRYEMSYRAPASPGVVDLRVLCSKGGGDCRLNP